MSIRNLVSSGNYNDHYFKNVSLLLSGDSSINGGQNNTFLDSSSNNFTITRNGNVTQGSFSPFGDRWSNYFNGSADYLSMASNAIFGMGTGDFTIEFWINPLSWSNVAYPIVVNGITGGLWIGKNNQNFVIRSYGTSDLLTTTNLPTIGKWTHIACVRASSILYIFYDGILITSVVSSYNFNTGTLAIGSDAVGAFYYGNISNLRIVKGTALYTSNFTPPTSPLTAISGTVLLTCQSNRFIDNSTYANAIIVNGTPSVQKFSPFSPVSEYNASVDGGSAYFDGSGDSLQNIGTTSSWNFLHNGSDFTVRFYVFNTGQPGEIVSTATWSWNIGIIVRINSYDQYSFGGANIVKVVMTNGDTNANGNTNTWGMFNSQASLVPNAWNYITLVYSNRQMFFYINGKLDSSPTKSNFTPSTSNSTYALSIGDMSILDSGRNPLLGNLSCLEILNGKLDSTTAITIPTLPYTPNITNTKLLCNFINGNVIDNSMNTDLETIGNAQISTSVKKYGTGSMYFDGNGDGLLLTNNLYSTIATGDFTIELWVYFSAVNNGTIQFLFDFRNSSATIAALLAQESNGSWTYNNGSGAAISTGWSSSTFSNNTWYHIGISRSNSIIKFFLNGVQTSSVSDTGSYGSKTLYIGMRYSTENFLNGYIDDLRITKGIARYTANFTPPTAPLPKQ